MSGTDGERSDSEHSYREEEPDLLGVSYRTVLNTLAEICKDLLRGKEVNRDTVADHMAGCQEELETPSSIPFVLPWSKGVQRANRDLSQQLKKGRKNKESSSSTGKKFLANPFGTRRTYYKVEGASTTPAAINRRFDFAIEKRERMLMTRPRKTGTTEDLRSMETALNSILQISSTLDWQVTAIIRISKALAAETESDDIRSLQRFLLSVARTTTQLIGEVATLRANVVLRRRDEAITHLPLQASGSMTFDLRTSSLEGPELFNNEAMDEMLSDLQKLLTTEHMIRSMKQRPSTSKSFSKSGQTFRSQPRQRRPFNDRPFNDRPFNDRQFNDRRRQNDRRPPFRERKDYKTRPKSSSNPSRGGRKGK